MSLVAQSIPAGRKIIQSVRSGDCEIPGCNRPVFGEPHHIKTRGSGGRDIRPNLINLCAEHHRQAQEYKIDRLELAQIVAGREDITPEEVCVAAGLPIPDTFPVLKEKPPEPSIEELIQAYISLEEQERECKWAKGQILDAMLQTGVKASWIASQVGASAAQVRELVKVHRAFPDEGMRVPDLSWYHHRVAANTDRPVEWINRAVGEQMSTREMRKAILQEEAGDEAKSAAEHFARVEEEKEVQEAKNVFAKTKKVLAKGGAGAEWLRGKLKDVFQEKEVCHGTVDLSQMRENDA
ncbi:MAG: HNH endonuclease [Dehalococcoidia bacterium]|nr:MAG: HNH endonuclease [Dehalococcoidia bacterium]